MKIFSLCLRSDSFINGHQQEKYIYEILNINEVNNILDIKFSSK